MNKKQAIKLAIKCMEEVRHKRHTFNANLYSKFHVDSQKKHYNKWEEINEAIRILGEIE